MLKQSVNLKLGTGLKLTPQLKASLRLLQMSVLDLELEIQQQLESNVMLERTDLNADSNSDTNSATQQVQNLSEDGTPKDKGDIEPASSETWDDIATSELDTNYTQATPGVKSSSGTDSRPEIADNRAQRLIYEFLIDALNVDGLLMESLDEIKQSLSVYISDLQLSDIKVSLKKLQSCEPAGIAATTLTECLQLQLERIKQRQGHLFKQGIIKETVTKETFDIAKVVIQNLNLLAENKLQPLRRECRTSVDKLDNALQLIRSLNPRPGAAFAQTENTHIVPDVVVKRHRDQWVLEINQQRLPKVHVNKEYAKHIRGTKNDLN